MTLTEIKKRVFDICSNLTNEEENKINAKEVFSELILLKRPNRILPNVNRTELTELLSFYFHVTLAKKDERKLEEKDLFSLESLQTLYEINDKNTLKSLMNSYGAVTTHPEAHNESLKKSKTNFSIDTSEELKHGISGVNFNNKNCAERFTISFNAKLFTFRYIFLLDFYLEGKRTSFIELVYKKDEDVMDFIESVGFSDEFISDLVSHTELLIEDGFSESVSGNQVFWYEGDYCEGSNYTLITPVPSAKMIAEVNQVLFKINQDDRRYINRKIKKIAGSKPQNASQLNQLMSGKSDLLFEDLSFINSAPRTALDKLSYEIVPQLLKPLHIHEREKSLLSGVLGTRQLKSFRSLIGRKFSEILIDLDFIAFEASKEMINNAQFTHEIEKKYMLGELKTREEKWEFAQYIYDHLLKELNGLDIDLTSSMMRLKETKIHIQKIAKVR